MVVALTRARRRLVIVESPYATNGGAPSDNGRTVDDNIGYARLCLYDCLKRGEAPLASHLLYPQVLNDANADERAWGLEAGLVWIAKADAVVGYVDNGISPGMAHAIVQAEAVGVPVERRKLFPRAW